MAYLGSAKTVEQNVEYESCYRVGKDMQAVLKLITDAFETVSNIRLFNLTHSDYQTK